MKKFYGTGCYVQSAGRAQRPGDRRLRGGGLPGDRASNWPATASRSFEEMRDWGDDLSGFDLIVALSPASQRQALELTRLYHLTVEYWPVLDPTGLGETREAKLAAYRLTRDQIRDRMLARFGPPVCDGGTGAARPDPPGSNRGGIERSPLRSAARRAARLSEAGADRRGGQSVPRSAGAKGHARPRSWRRWRPVRATIPAAAPLVSAWAHRLSGSGNREPPCGVPDSRSGFNALKIAPAGRIGRLACRMAGRDME